MRVRPGPPRGAFALAVLLLGPAASVSASADPPPGGGDRPILYVEPVGEGEKARPVVVARSPDGKEVASFPNALAAAWSPDGRRFAAIEGREGDDTLRALKVVDLAHASRVVYRLESAEEALVWYPAWSPDGSRLAAVVARWVKGPKAPRPFWLAVVDVAKGEALARHPLPDGTLAFPFAQAPPDKLRWSPDGRGVLVSWENAVVVDAGSGRVTRVSDKPVVAEWSADGSAVDFLGDPHADAFRGDDDRLGFHRLTLGDPNPKTVADAKALKTACWSAYPGRHFGLLTLSPDGRRLAVLEGTGVGFLGRPKPPALRVFDLKGNAPPALDRPDRTVTTPDMVLALDWSPDGTRLAALTIDPRQRVALKALDPASGEWSELRRINVDLTARGPAAMSFLGVIKYVSWSR